MTSVPNPHHHRASAASNLPRNPNATATADHPNPNLDTSRDDLILSRASHLTRSEVLRRRSRHLKRLSRCYRDHYWVLMEEVKAHHRDYYWKYGVSPFKDAGDDGGSGVEGIGENSSNNRCSFVGCKLKAMALTRFCHLHILSDAKQKLYIPCSYVIMSSQSGDIKCGKPILRSIQPALCTVHFQKAQKHVTNALKKAGLNVNSSSKLAPKFHVLVAEYVCRIQTHRRAARKEKGEGGAK